MFKIFASSTFNSLTPIKLTSSFYIIEDSVDLMNININNS